jgi:hypothetical protein
LARSRRITGATVGLFLAVKAGSWLLVRARTGGHALSPLEGLLFWTAWPGVRPDNVTGADEHAGPDARTP